MDDAGNFVIAWSGTGQDLSFFNSIHAQRYAHDGTPVGQEMLISNYSNTASDSHYDPAVTMSSDGHCIVTWTHMTAAEGHAVYARVFDAQGNMLLDYSNAPNGGLGVIQATGLQDPSPTAAFDDNNNFAISWTQRRDQDLITEVAPQTAGVYFREYSITGTVLRTPDQRANSALSAGGAMIGLTPDGSIATWPLAQVNGQVVMDADGDLTVSYEGFGPDTAQTASSGSASRTMQQILAQPQNADLLAIWPGLASLSLPYGGDNNADPDSEIEEVLIHAQKDYGFTDEQLGRLNSILSLALEYTRGEANGVMYTQYDAAPNYGAQNVLESDVIVNDQRDGSNSRLIIALDRNITSGNFIITVQNGDADPNPTAVTITPAYTPGANPVIDPAGTVNNILAALRGVTSELGVNWPLPNLASPVTCRLMSAAEVQERQGTHWDTGLASQANTLWFFEIDFIGEAHDTTITVAPPNYPWNNLLLPNSVPAPAPNFVTETQGSNGTSQHDASIAMTPDGNFVVTWTQDDTDTSGMHSGQSVYYRVYTQSVDTAGPKVADVNASASTGVTIQTTSGVLELPGQTVIDPAAAVHVDGGIQHLVVSFDEPMFDNTTHTGDAVSNPTNYKLLLNGVEVKGAVVSVQYGLNEASELAQMASDNPTLYGQYSDLSALPMNHYEAVVTIDGNVGAAGIQSLGKGDYTLEAIAPVAATATTAAQNGLRDVAGNALGSNGFVPGGKNYSLSFSVVMDLPDTPVTNTNATNGRTYAESPGAAAVDGDGDHIVVYTAKAPATGLDRVYVAMYNADGSPSARKPAAFAVTPTVAAGVSQRYATVACDGDGDFVVTWTQVGTNGYGDVYGCRFNSVGVAQTAIGTNSDGSFRLNTYTANNQQWSNVAMDTAGNFIVTWTSYGQEDNGQNGLGYGVYARRYDSFGAPLASEFQVNVTTAGDQQDSTVSLADNGMFVVAWQSSQDGVDDDIYSRVFNADGSAYVDPNPNGFGGSPLTGERSVNTTTAGNQRYPDVAMNLAGTQYIVTWESSGQDGSGWGIYSRTLLVTTPPAATRVNNVSKTIPDSATARPTSPIEWPTDDTIQTVTVSFAIVSNRPVNLSDLTIWLTGPFSKNPDADPGTPGFDGAILVDRVPGFSGAFTGPALNADGTTNYGAGDSAVGGWTLHVWDHQG